MVNMRAEKCRTCGRKIVLTLVTPLDHDECAKCRQARENEAEAAYERQQQSLTESGGPDDSTYRRDMIAAGRGHLLR